MGFQNILFDLDGTITDPSEGIEKCINFALQKLGEPPCPPEKIPAFIGPPLLDGYMMNLGFTEEKARACVEAYRIRYDREGFLENKLIPGAGELLTALKSAGKTIGVATSKPEPIALRVLLHFGLLEYFSFVSGAEWDVSGRNSKPDVINHALKEMSLTDKKRDTVLIGDRFYDIDGAHECGIAGIGVLTGFGTREEFIRAGADFIAESLPDCLRFC